MKDATKGRISRILHKGEDRLLGWRQAGILILSLYLTGVLAPSRAAGNTKFASGLADITIRSIPSGTVEFVPQFTWPCSIPFKMAMPKALAAVPSSISCSIGLLDTTVTPPCWPPAAIAFGITIWPIFSGGCGSGMGAGTSVTTQFASLNAATKSIAKLNPSDDSDRYQIWTAFFGFPSNSLTNHVTADDNDISENGHIRFPDRLFVGAIVVILISGIAAIWLQLRQIFRRKR